MTAIRIRQATHDDFDYVARHLRTSDVIELKALGICAVMEHVQNGWRWGGVRKCMLIDSAPAAIFGASPSTEPGRGIPWMLATEHINAIKREVVLRSRIEVERMQAKFPVLGNLVHVENTVSIKWLEWLGFQIGRTPTGPGGQFYYFSRTR